MGAPARRVRRPCRAGASPDALAGVSPGSGTEIALDQEPGSQALVAGDGSRTPIDVVFPVMHGPYGEDGSIQGFLEMAGVPYVGAGVLASAVGMDKAVQKVLFAAAGIPGVPYEVVHERDWEEDPEAVEARASHLGYPLFAKPAGARVLDRDRTGRRPVAAARRPGDDLPVRPQGGARTRRPPARASSRSRSWATTTRWPRSRARSSRGATRSTTSRRSTSTSTAPSW